ncbi:hypothetical protein RFI_10628 [Reticulomyxa filosa]|uniref:Uncharacterized protein n=1 Tax=Reticulomyxa filosa TaxID=46433 RepID=X6NKS0_RETFI|nr:hypothetical protein RFI_10628 [Reticulomyxa filosa]|eukprot:ETO26508.1 hypothetical protein RFI_10628 [Reticulomyxa filosa]
MCALLINGNKNDLLFITYYPNNISIFNLNKFQFIKYDKLPINNYINYHCFISNNMMKNLIFFNFINYLIFFGKDIFSRSIYKYIIQKDKYILPIPLYNCIGIINENNTYIHIIGGCNSKKDILSIQNNFMERFIRFGKYIYIFLNKFYL